MRLNWSVIFCSSYLFDKADKIKPGSSQTLKDKALQLVGGNPSAPVLPAGKNSLVYFLKETHKADIFLSYYTSGKAAQSLKDGNDLQLIELPDYLATKADYGLTVLKNADPDSEKLVAYILSPEGQAILARNGFSKKGSYAEGRRQKEYCPLSSAATKRVLGLSPTPKSLIWCPAISVGLKPN
ncbi:MAG: substrate-binding domain-containing protein [Nostoc sp.]|uniref:substrate-binding domain-containing protein n=1 Tax=Nostoc sp. TaxID=1180 RepID=UPI002FF97BBD